MSSIYMLFALYKILYIYQGMHYKVLDCLNLLFKNIMKSFPFYLLGILIGICEIFFLSSYIYLFLIPLILYAILDNYKSRGHLIFTKRIFRMTILFGLTIFLDIFLLDRFLSILFCFFSIPLFFVLILPNILLEEIIYMIYFNKNKKQLKAYNGIKIAITGSYGKTSTKYYLSELLKEKYTVFTTPKSYNTPNGIGKSLSSLSPLDEIAIFEMGATRRKDISTLMKLIHPDISVITSIGPQHISSFHSIKNILKEKKKAFDMLEEENTGYYLKNNPYLDFNIVEGNKRISYGINCGMYSIQNIEYRLFENQILTEFDFFKNNQFLFHSDTKILGYVHLYDICCGIAIALDLKVPIDKISEKIKILENYKNRLFFSKIKENLFLLDDSYNSNIEGAISALEVLQKLPGEKIVYTPGFVELGILETTLLEKLFLKINEVADKVYLESNLYKKSVVQLFTIPVFSIENPILLLKKLSEETLLNTTFILIENDVPDYYVR